MDALKSRFGALASVVAAMSSVGSLGLLWKAYFGKYWFSEEEVAIVSFCLPYTAGAWLVGGSAWLWSSWCAQRRRDNDIQAKAQSLVKIEMEQHQAMWHGTRMAVDAVKDTADRLCNLADSRTERRQILTKQMLQDLWTMSMAIDEMIVWMSQHGCFPPNYSVRNMVTPLRYDKIFNTFKQITNSLKPSLGGA